MILSPWRTLQILMTLFALVFPTDSLSAQSKKVLIIGVDGLRPDAMEVSFTPNIDALIANGTYSPIATSSERTFSGPGWTDFMHGIHRNDHAVNTNSTSPNPLNPAFSIFSNSNQHLFPDALAIANVANPSLNTGRFVGGWSPILTTRTPEGSEYTFQGSDDAAADNAADFYTNNDADIGYLYLANPDFAGHAHGFNPSIAEYRAEIAVTDSRIGQVIDAIKARPGYIDGSEDWIFILSSDHGGDLNLGHSGNRPWQRRVPFIVSGNSVQNQVLTYDAKLVDVVPTAIAHLGLPVPDHLVGHVVGLQGADDPRPQIALDVNLVFNGDGEYDEGFDQHGMDQAITGWDEYPDADYILETSSMFGADTATILEYGTPGGFPSNASPGPLDRGSNFISAGAGSSASEMVQRIDVSEFATSIDLNQIDFVMSAFLGGFGNQDDAANFSARFFGANGTSLLGTQTLIGPTAAERNNVTGLFSKLIIGDVPVSTRFVDFVLTTSGNDGYADNLSFVIFENCDSSSNNPAIVTPTPGTTEWRFNGSLNPIVGPGTLEAEGNAANTDSFTTATIEGESVNVLQFTQRLSNNDGYTGRSGVDGSLDGGDPQGIDRFTMIMDIRFDDAAQSMLGIWNGNAFNGNVAEFFIEPDTGGFWMPGTGSIAPGTLRPNQFHRIAFVNDFPADEVNVYVDGSLAFTTTSPDYVWDGDPNPFWFLTTFNPADTGSGQIAAFAFVDSIMLATEISDLGSPSAAGIFPQSPPTGIVAENVSVAQGSIFSGTVNDTFVSDDSQLVLIGETAKAPSAIPVLAEFETNVGSPTSSALSLLLESTSNTPNLSRRIEFFDWTTDQFVEVDLSSQSNGADTTQCITVNDAENYIDEKGNLRIRIGWSADGPVLFYPWKVSLDQLLFTSAN